MSSPKKVAPEGAWINNMHRLSAAYLQLMPATGDPRAFGDKKNSETVESNIVQLAQGAAQAAHDPKAPAVDPIIAFTAARFAIDTKLTYAGYKSGDQQWARYALAHTGDYCISCHTRADNGAKDFALPWQPDVSALTQVQRVEFYLANRQYATASLEANKLAKDQAYVRLDPAGYQVALEKVMAMTVRVQKDPVAASSLAERMLENTETPNYIRREALEWLREIQIWQYRPGKYKTENDKFHAAVRLLENTRFPVLDRPKLALINNLRASGLLHELLENKNSAFYGELLFYAGLAEEALQSLNIYGLCQAYFEACIRKQPHSELSERCYGRLQESVRAANPFLGRDSEGDTMLALYLADLRHLSEIPNDPKLKGPFKFRELDSDPK